jgi:hypothetical protein
MAVEELKWEAADGRRAARAARRLDERAARARPSRGLRVDWRSSRRRFSGATPAAAKPVLQGRSAPGGARAHLVHLPRVRLPSTGGAQQERPELHQVLARDQPRGAQGQGRRAPPDADPPAHRPVAGRPGAMAEPHRRRVDQLLRPVLPNRARSPPEARQHLPEALGWKEVQTAADRQVLPRVVDRAARKAARPVRPLALGPHVPRLIRRAR